MKKTFILSFFVLGFTSLISQVVIIRELASSFYGNEFFIGWLLCIWFFWSGLGSYFENKFFKFSGKGSIAFVFCHLSVAVLFPVLLALIRSGKVLLKTPAGAIPDLFPVFFFSFVVLGPFCLILGLQFALAARCWVRQDSETKMSSVIGRSYLYEILGFVIGGILFSYVLVFANEFKIALYLLLLNFLTAGILFFHVKDRRQKIFPVFCALAAVLSVAMWGGVGFLQLETSRWRFPTEVLVETRNTVHGNLAVTRIGSQYNFYQNGILLGAAEEKIANEHLIHFPMLFHPNPRKVLLVGTGFNGTLREILKYDPDKVEYVELDSTQVAIAQKYISPELQQALKDHRVRVWTEDSRLFLKINQETFDVVIVNAPNPSTVLLNRQYTAEFFYKIQKHLAPGGVVAIRLKFAPDYVSPELESLVASIHKTLKRFFPNLVVLPEDTLYMIASSASLPSDPKVLVTRLERREINNDFVTAAYIQYRLINDRVDKVRTLLEANKSAKINRDSRPRGYYYDFLYWTSSFHPRLAKIVSWPLKVPLLFLLGGISFLFVFLWRACSDPRCFAKTAMAAGGFSLMSTEILLIYGFQVFYGNLYYRIAWIITAFMAGIGIGTWVGNRKLLEKPRPALGWLHLIVSGYFFLLAVCWWALSRNFVGTTYGEQMLFLLMAGAMGCVVGLEFPWAMQLFFSQFRVQEMKTGSVYAADLFGSCLGALLTAGFLIPVWGIYRTLLLLFFMNVAISLLLFFRKDLSRKDL